MQWSSGTDYQWCDKSSVAHSVYLNWMGFYIMWSMLDGSCWAKTAVVKVRACFMQKIKPNNHQPISLLLETEICQKQGKGCSLCLFLDWSFQGLYRTSVLWFYFCSIAESQMWFYGFANLVGFWLLLLYLTLKEKDSELSVWNVFSYEITVKLRVTRLLFIKITWKNFQLLWSEL